MSFKKKFPTSNQGHGFDDPYSSSNNRGYGNNARNEDQNSPFFSENFNQKIDYRPDNVFDFESYKKKIVQIMEIFREDILNVKSNLSQLFGIADKHIYKDFFDLTNNLVALTQHKLEQAISKSNSLQRNFNEKDLSVQILGRIGVDELRDGIRERLSNLREEMESYLTEDRYYRKATFAVSDLALILEKIFKIYDILNEENSILNYIKIDETSLYEHIFHDKIELNYEDIVHLNVPLIQERLKVENMYRTGAGVTKDRLLFRVDDILQRNPDSYSLNSITQYIKTQILREKFTIKKSLLAVFQKVLPNGLKLTGEAEQCRKEITEEMDALKEGIDYLEGHQKSYIKIVTGAYNPEYIQGMSFTVSNVDLLIDIEKLFFIVQDLTNRVRDILQKIKEYHEIEAQDITNGVENSFEAILNSLAKENEGKFDIELIISQLFEDLENLIEKEKNNKDKFMEEKKKIDQQRQELEGGSTLPHQETPSAQKQQSGYAYEKSRKDQFSTGGPSGYAETKETNFSRNNDYDRKPGPTSSNVPSTIKNFQKPQQKQQQQKEDGYNAHKNFDLGEENKSNKKTDKFSSNEKTSYAERSSTQDRYGGDFDSSAKKSQ